VEEQDPLPHSARNSKLSVSLWNAIRPAEQSQSHHVSFLVPYFSLVHYIGQSVCVYVTTNRRRLLQRAHWQQQHVATCSLSCSLSRVCNAGHDFCHQQAGVVRWLSTAVMAMSRWPSLAYCLRYAQSWVVSDRVPAGRLDCMWVIQPCTDGLSRSNSSMSPR